MQNLHKVHLIFLTCFAIGLNSCKKFVDVGAPVTSTNSENVYSSDATAISVLSGLFADLSNSSFTQGNTGVSLLPGLSADEFALVNGADAAPTAYYTNSLSVTSTESTGSDFWNPLYEFIYTANSAIEGLNKSTSLLPGVKQQLLGEAKFIRAFCHFYLVNFFGDVPLVTTTDYTVTATMPRTPKAKVYDQIIDDLKDAQQLLSEDYLNGALKPYSGEKERVRPTKWAADALLARVYLYNHQWDKAEEQASLVINNTALYDTVPLNQVFLKGSREAIWQLQPIGENFNTVDAQLFVITSNGLNGSNPVQLSDSLLNAFEPGDKRKENSNWVNSETIGGIDLYYPFKYKINQFDPDITSSTGPGNMTEYLMVLRLAEQYLIRAEARAQLGSTSGAVSDLNVIRNRAKLTNYGGPTALAPLLSAILHERQVELFTEWGHRWLDLKRTQTIDAVMTSITPIKSNGGAWQSYQQFYPIPFQEIQRNPSLQQTPGY